MKPPRKKKNSENKTQVIEVKISAPIQIEDTRHRNGRKWNECDATEKLSFAVNGTLALLTLGLLFLGFCQYKDIKDRNRIELRAYLSVMTPELKRSDTLTVYLYFENNGQTPAYEIKDSTMLGIFRNEELEKIEDPHNWIPTLSKKVLNPKEKTVRYLHPTKMSIRLKDFSSEKHRIVVLGKVTYKDAYGKKHWNTYGYSLTFLHHGFTAYGNYNDTDNDLL